ncbi:MAG TPA: response regulator transcription factor, partial [Polyangia bacterium]|nr:response regulator transcription factor [Polyangia bacterium]
ATGEKGLAEIAEFRPELVLLDVMLPDLSGIEVCRRIRALSDLPQPVVVMLTARGDEMDRVVGFEVGADDYMVKPFSVRELMLRMSARLKARGATPAPPAKVDKAGPPARRRLVAGSLEVDPDGHHVYVAGSEVSVSALEMRILVYLFDARGIVRTRHDLLTQVWGYQPEVNSRTVDTHVKRLRQKLGQAGALIETVRGLGYRLTDQDGDGAAAKK